MADDSILSRILGAMGDNTYTPFGWIPNRHIQGAIAGAQSPSGIAGLADGLGAPVDAASWLWRQSDLNTPEVRNRIYQTPPMLGSDSIRSFLGGDPAHTPGRGWTNFDGSQGPEATRPTGPVRQPVSIFDVLTSQNGPSALSHILRRAR